ncbi:MAG: PAS domain-containing protein, partial [Bacteroidales bacterium]
GHPADTFMKENRELGKVINSLGILLAQASNLKQNEVKGWLISVHTLFNSLMDVDKHYRRKEYLLFPFLEKYGITGPPKVMWGKHDEIRQLLKASIEAISLKEDVTTQEVVSITELLLIPATRGVDDMIAKEEEILLPMCLDKLSDEEWYSIYLQTIEFGYCLYDPSDEWKPENVVAGEVKYNTGSTIGLQTGSFNLDELEAIFRTLPVDLTFVDRDDKVKFFSLGPDRIFTRNRAILGRDVRMCHPPGSVHVVEQILADFKSGSQNNAAFWINMKGRFIYIEYFAIRGKDGEYLGTIEFTQDLTGLRSLEGEQRLLAYNKKA